MIPGLTADHNLFESQIQYFSDKVNFMVWDAPGHGESRPWTKTCEIDEMADLLFKIIELEDIEQPILIGHSLGGYIAQALMHKYPDVASGFVSIDSSPIRKSFYSWFDLFVLRHTYLICLLLSWKTLVSSVSKRSSATQYGQNYMKRTLEQFDKHEYCKLVSETYADLSNTIACMDPYLVNCPMICICGRKDEVGSVRKYNRRWVKQEGVDMVWLASAGHNSNMDEPGIVNDTIDRFIAKVWQTPER